MYYIRGDTFQLNVTNSLTDTSMNVSTSVVSTYFYSRVFGVSYWSGSTGTDLFNVGRLGLTGLHSSANALLDRIIVLSIISKLYGSHFVIFPTFRLLLLLQSSAGTFWLVILS